MQRPRPPLTIAASGKRALRVVAERADVWVSGASGSSVEEARRRFRERGEIVDEHCRAIGRDPETIERAWLVGWDPDAPFVSADAFHDNVGQFRDVGVQRFIFSFGSEATPAPYDEWIRAGKWAARDTLDAFAAQAMVDLQGASNAQPL